MTAQFFRSIPLTLALLAAPALAADPVPGPTAPAPGQSMSIDEPTPAATPPPAKPAAPVDLNPRPLGRAPAPKTKPVTETTAAATAAPQPSLIDSPVLRTTLSLAIVLSLIGACAVAMRFLKRRGVLPGTLATGSRAPSGVLEMLGRYPLGRGQTLLLIKLDQRVLLVGQTVGTLRAGGGSLTTLCELSDPEDVASVLLKAQDAADASAAAKFQHMLREFDDRHGLSSREPDVETPATVNLRAARSTPAGDRAELWNDRADVRNIPLVPVQTDRRVQAQQAQAAQSQSQAQSQPADSFVSLRDRLSALRGEAHR